MAIVKRKNLCIAREYVLSNGEKKTRWQPIGKAFYNDSGKEFLRIDAIPTGNWDGTVQVFDEQQPQENTERSYNRSTSAPRSYDNPDDLPF